MSQVLRVNPKKTAPLYESDVSTLRNALVVAAERFDEHAAEFAAGRAAFDALDEAGKVAYFDTGDTPGVAILRPNPTFYDDLKAQFERQARETRELIEKLDGPEDAEDVQIIVVWDTDIEASPAWAR